MKSKICFSEFITDQQTGLLCKNSNSCVNIRYSVALLLNVHFIRTHIYQLFTLLGFCVEREDMHFLLLILE